MEHHGFQSDVSHLCPSAPDYGQFYPHQPACGQPQPGGVQPSSHPCHTAVQLGERSLFAGEMEHHGFQSDVSHPCPSAPDYEQFYPHQPACGQPQPGCVQPSSHPCHTAVQLGEPALQHLQQIVLVVDGKPTTVYVSQVSPIPVSMVSAFVLSCLAFWLCGFLFGGIAFLLAMQGNRSLSAGNTAGASRLRQASIILSIVGIFIGSTAIIICITMLII